MSLLRTYEWTGDEKCLGAVKAWYEFFDRHCRQVYGVTAMDEEWGWRGEKKRSAAGLIFEKVWMAAADFDH